MLLATNRQLNKRLLLTVLDLVDGLLGELGGNSDDVGSGDALNLLKPLGVLGSQHCQCRRGGSAKETAEINQ